MLTYDPSTPILFIYNNCVEHTCLIFEKIRYVKPRKLYLAGFVPANPEYLEDHLNAAKIVSNIDWDCDVKTRYSDLYSGMTENAISWFFENEPEGIVIEGNYLPSYSFFGFCSQLLAKYRDNEHISIISGGNYNNKTHDRDVSYYFSAFTETPGWAAWRRSWEGYKKHPDSTIAGSISMLDTLLSDSPLKKHWLNLLKGDHISWNDKFAFTNFINGKLSIVPNVNLSDYMYGYSDKSSKLNELDEIIHPEFIICDTWADIRSQEVKLGMPVITKNAPDGQSFLKEKLLGSDASSIPASDRMEIPKIIHQLYDSPTGPPEILLQVAESWREKNPEWEYRFWDKEKMDEFIENEFPEFVSIYRSYPYDVQRWDAIRYFILYKTGGIYVDFDYECIEPLDILLCDSTCCMGMEPTLNAIKQEERLIVGNAFMATVPEHEYFRKLIEDLYENHKRTWHADKGAQIMRSTGPFLTTRVYEQLSENDKENVTLIPADLVAPLTMDEVKMMFNNDITPEIEDKVENAFAIHYFLGLWVDQTHKMKESKKISEKLQV